MVPKSQGGAGRAPDKRRNIGPSHCYRSHRRVPRHRTGRLFSSAAKSPAVSVLFCACRTLDTFRSPRLRLRRLLVMPLVSSYNVQNSSLYSRVILRPHRPLQCDGVDPGVGTVALTPTTSPIIPGDSTVQGL